MGIDWWRSTNLNHCLQLRICLILLNKGSMLDVLLHILGNRLWRSLHGGTEAVVCPGSVLDLTASALRSKPWRTFATQTVWVSQRRRVPFLERA